MSQPEFNEREERLKEALKQDLQRHARREPGHNTLWRSLALIGGVGWPIAISTVGGALVGRRIDVALDTGVQFTLALLVIGAAMGSWISWRLVSEVGNK